MTLDVEADSVRGLTPSGSPLLVLSIMPAVQPSLAAKQLIDRIGLLGGRAGFDSGRADRMRVCRLLGHNAAMNRFQSSRPNVGCIHGDDLHRRMIRLVRIQRRRGHVLITRHRCTVAVWLEVFFGHFVTLRADA